MKRRGYIGHAKRRWRRAAWVRGQGPYALVAYCNVTTVSLHLTYVDALCGRLFIDGCGCGHRCYRRHRIFNLDKELA